MGVAELTSSVSTMPLKRVSVNPKPWACTSIEPVTGPIGVFVFVSETTCSTWSCASACVFGISSVPCT